jgi:hypothetical protein
MGKSNRVHGEVQGDLFGKPVPTQRGWTELDAIRRRYAVLLRKVNNGEYSSAEMEEYNTIRVQIKFRENEAREKWERSFKK